MKQIDKKTNKVRARIPGIAMYHAEKDLRESQKPQISQDTKNRNYVVEKMTEYMQNGLTEDEAVEKIMKDPIVEQFEYLTKNKIDIRRCFRDWTRNTNNNKKTKAENIR